MTSHYQHGNFESIEVLEHVLTPEEFAGFLKGNIMKYMYRHHRKGGRADLVKAHDYLHRLLYGEWYKG